ncbi:hypothetical protein [Nitrososphaera sp.]|uniref:hypothetical protein n=1 Tax=Nitrososphaera sp. TaxID=1971748 RepID=UPI00307E8666
MHMGVAHYGSSIITDRLIGTGSESSYSIINSVYREVTRNKADFILRWEEGYDDVDMKVTSPSGTSYFSTGAAPQTIEQFKLDNPATGTWNIYEKIFLMSSFDENLTLRAASYATTYTTGP